MLKPTNLLDGLKTWGINRGGHKLGLMIAEALWKRPVVRSFVTANPAMAKMIAEGAVFTTSLLELGGDHPLVRLANNISEVIATESVEILDEIEKNPASAQAKIDAKVGEVIESDAWLAGVIVHKNKKCSVLNEYVADMTPPERKGKDDKIVKEPTRARVTQVLVQDALQAGKLLCPVCFPPAFEIKGAKKAESRTFGELLKDLAAKEPDLFREKFIDEAGDYPVETAKDPKLAKKFFQAFHRNRGLDDLIFLLKQPHARWRMILDGYIGETTVSEAVVDREMREFGEMLMKLSVELKKLPAWSDQMIEASEARRTARQKKKPAARRKQSATVLYLVVGACIFLLVAYVIMQSTLA